MQTGTCQGLAAAQHVLLHLRPGTAACSLSVTGSHCSMSPVWRRLSSLRTTPSVVSRPQCRAALCGGSRGSMPAAAAQLSRQHGDGWPCCHSSAFGVTQHRSRGMQFSCAGTGQEAAPQSQAPAPPRRKRVLSGVQPTGTLHLGNYFGAIRNWVQLQDLYDTYFMMADLHAITVPHDPKELLQSTKKTAALYIACGINPDKAAVFVQSHISAHAELAWLLQCYTPIGWLRKMIQFKTKSEKQGEEVGAGLLTYPALMAADILLYQADLVPVGDDQKQHLELTRDLAERFNSKFGGRNWQKLGGPKRRLFNIPEPFIPPAGARVMSLTDGTNKMSKSAESDMSRINLLDDAKLITKKIKSAKTDTYEGLEFDNPNRPEARNLMTLYALATGMSMESVMEEVANLQWGDFKPRLADALVEHLEPVRNNYTEIMKDEGYLSEVLRRGADAADEVAARTVANCRQAMGFAPR